MSNGKLWGGRFRERTDPAVERFTHSFAVDSRLARHDLLGSLAHARMLGRKRIIPAADSAKLVRGLQALLRQSEKGTLKLNSQAEDVHTALQQALEKKVGAAAGKLHTARSRNDQVVTALRLYAHEQLHEQAEAVRNLQKQILQQASACGELAIPGYTHLRHAQPILAAHLLLSYLEMLERDRHRLLAAAASARAELPLGSGALTGTCLPIDRVSVAKELGFSGIKTNSIDATTDRDFVGEALCALSLLAVHASRVAEELIFFSTAEFGFVRFNEKMLTGSSMMPQKQNPDFLELVRGESARVIGQITSFFALVKGLASGYQRDLQLDKGILFDALDRTAGMLSVLIPGIQGMRWNSAAAQTQLRDESLYATDLAEYLVQKGVAFSEAHRAVGQLLAHAHRNRLSLKTLPLSVYRKFSSRFGEEARRLIDPRTSVSRKRSAGSTSPLLVSREIARWKRLLRS
ncbi:MAG: argininosuccinate lyase [Candidatus Omnitrophica bacterium]|nr:argininosuccinate lyase [Candidatus Omnitrophota bacterium]